MKYLNSDLAIKIHDYIIMETGGVFGVRNNNLLESPFEAIKNDNFYPTLDEKVAFLMYSMIKNHPFADGNKRSAVGVCSIFLMINGYNDRDIQLFAIMFESVAVKIASSEISREETVRLVRSFQEFSFYQDVLGLPEQNSRDII